MKNNKILKFAVKLVISLFLVAWLVFKINWTEVWSYLGQIKLWQIALYYLVLIAGMLISSYKWQVMAKFKGIHLPFFDFFKYYLAGTFVNNFMPSFIGGDTFRAYQIGKGEKKYKEAASTVVADRITGLLGAMILALVFSLSNASSISHSDVLISVNTFVAGALMAIFLFLLIRKMPFWKSIARFLPKKVLEFIQIMNSFTEKGILTRSLLYSFLFALVGLAASNYVLFVALGSGVGLLDYLSVIFLISIVSSIPVSVNNIGIKEWAYVTFFGFFGVSSSLVVTIAILSRILQMVLSFAALPVYLKSKKIER